MILLPFLALALTLALIPLACRAAAATGYLDEPGGRKKHADAIPPVGGIVIFTVFIAINWFGGIDTLHSLPYYGALALLLATGFIDDRWPLPPLVKLLAHISAALLIVVIGKAKLIGLGTLLGPTPFELGTWAAPFTVLAVVFLINAMNMIDGVDGLAGGIGVIILGGLLLSTLADGIAADYVPLMVLLGGLAGFLWYNMRHRYNARARVFMGDAGSMALGLSIGWYCVNITNDAHTTVSPVFIAWLVAVPAMDAFGLFIMRLTEGRHPFSADRRHFHHHFQRSAGYSAQQTTAIILAYQVVLAVIGYYGVLLLPDYIMGWAWITLLAAHTTIVLMPATFISLIKKKTRSQSCVEDRTEDRMAA